MAYRITVNLDYRNLQETMAMKEGKQVKAKTGVIAIPNVICTAANTHYSFSAKPT